MQISIISTMNRTPTILIIGENTGMSHVVSTLGLRPILADPEAPSGKVGLKNRRSTRALARRTMATFRVPSVPS